MSTSATIDDVLFALRERGIEPSADGDAWHAHCPHCTSALFPNERPR